MSELRRESGELRKALVGDLGGLAPFAARSPEDRIKIDAYLVLSHALIEEAVENAFRAHCSYLANAMFGPEVPVACVDLATVAMSELHVELPKLGKRLAATAVRYQVQPQFEKVLRANHGIRDANLMTLAKCLGIPWPWLEDELGAHMVALNTLAGKRGDSSHLSPFRVRAQGVQEDYDLDEVQVWIDDAIRALEALEILLARRLQAPRLATSIVDWDGN